MSSEPGGSPDPVVRLADVLARASDGVRPTPLELAGVLWLARHMRPGTGTTGRETGKREAEGREASERTPPSPPTPTPTPPPEQPPPAPEPSAPAGPPPAHEPPPAPARVPLHLPARRPARAAVRPHAPLLAPAPPMLRHRLALHRALRPLARRTDAPVGRELDERATADRIARLGADPAWWLPVLRPARERWLRLNLVYDAGPTMPVWRPLVRELQGVLGESGAFRTIGLYRADADGRVRGPGVPAPADGRTVTLLISDCMGPQWREGPAGKHWYATLHRWARRMPLAVVNPLPEHLWRDTALPAQPGSLSAPHPAAPSAALTFTPYDRCAGPGPDERARPGGTVPLPVLEPEPRWLAHWAGLLATPGGAEFPAAVAGLGRPLPADAEDRTDVGRLTAEELVLRFRATASPEAVRLAGHLAVGRPDLPVMRLVQAAVEPDPRPRHLAEVILSGMLTTVPGGPAGCYAFRDGVRELLLLGLPRTERHRTTELLNRIGEFIDRRAGRAPGEFRASVPSARGAGTAVEDDPFAMVREDSARRLSADGTRDLSAAGARVSSAEDARGLSADGTGALFAGRYRLLRPVEGTLIRDSTGRPAEGMGWLAEDTREGDAPVVVHRYPALYADADFTQRCRRLRLVRHPLVAPVLDHGIEGDVPYVVRAFVPGQTLLQRLEETGGRLPVDELVALLPKLAMGIDALYTGGGSRGLLRPDTVALTPYGPVLTCLTSAPLAVEGHVGALRTLGRLIRDIYGGDASEELEARLDTAASELLSESPEVQRHGVELLLGLDSGPRPGPLGFSLFGPLEATRDGRPLLVPLPHDQAVLCMLLLNRGRPAPPEELASGLSDTPWASTSSVESCLLRLRWALGPDLLTTDDGHALDFGNVSAPEDIDVFRFRRLAAGAQRSRAAGDRGNARQQSAEALELWRGEPLHRVPGRAAQDVREELEALRRTLHTILEAEEEPPAEPPGIHFTADDLTGRPEARVTLEAAVHEILARGSVGPRQYEVTVRPDGYLVRTAPGAYLLPVLVAVLRELPYALNRLSDPPRLTVTFGRPPVAPPETAADVTIVVPPALYDEFAASSAAQRARSFRPLFTDGDPDSPPAAWYCPLGPKAAEPGERDLVQGPFITADLRELGVPTPGRTAVVHTRPDGPLTLLDPIQPYGTRPPRPETYYSVDLTSHEIRRIVSLPSSGKGAFQAAVLLTWRVADPVAFVRAEATGIPELLLRHLCAAAAPITRRHPLRRAGAAQRAVNTGVTDWPVPGLAVSCAVQLVPEWAPVPAAEPPVPSRRRLSTLLDDAETVLVGFEGPLTRLFTAHSAREAVLDLLSVVADHRDPQDALSGRPLPAASAAGREAFAHPLDLLRAFAHDRLGPLLGARLGELELAAVPDAPMTHRSLALVRALHRSGRRVSVVTDVSTAAVHHCLLPYRLPLAGVHGRRDDLGLLTPHPDCLLRALDAAGTPPRGGVLISSSVAELTAAQQLGVRFIGYAPTAAGRRRLRGEGSEVTVSSLEPLLEAARVL
ncbi:SAV_2336 N-terminal domain-related protein [Streptomyces lavenduligriseus]|uniref:Serine/threonine protein kinase n=1 Tax=Streptomyces lavenduligriseus TaxID=67315 RepID=A0ABT0P162_9ACTN|nr:SAV_2336 N-terminal domain-related protein [Streptomyces lavenduligriseus]MCL3997341.1 serine/threonine protein kinase [Streptomyces lavenduligriseus]